MTRKEVGARYRIPVSLLREYDAWGLGPPGEYGKADLRRLEVLMTLRDLGFTPRERETYLHLLEAPAQSAVRRLRMLEEKRRETLSVIHGYERQLLQLDCLRHELETKIRSEEK